MKTIINDEKQSRGRSMVEMIGVLALIGILSIGSLSAYEYAMDSHEANNILEFINKLSITAQTRNQVIQAPQDCLAAFPIESTNPTMISSNPQAPTYPDYVKTCKIVYEKYGHVSIYIEYTIDTPSRVLSMINSRKTRSMDVQQPNTGDKIQIFDINASAASKRETSYPVIK